MTTPQFLEPRETARQTGTTRNETVHMSLYDAFASPESERRYTTASMDFDSLPDVEALARRQGVSSNTKFEDLLGDFWPEDQSVEDFLEARKRWRREGNNSTD
jgi:hypothetical protein